MKPWVLLIFAATSWPALGAQPNGLSTELMSIGLSLALVVIIILALAFFVKKLNPNFVNNEDFKVVRSLSVGAKERLLVVEIDDKQHLIGVTSQNISYLHQLDTPISNQAYTPFSQELQKLLSGNKQD